MALFPDISLITLPDHEAAQATGLQADPLKELLVVYDGNLSFLERVLAAAGYDDPATQLHLIELPEEEGSTLDFSTLVQHLNVSRVIIFGQDLPKLGLHFVVQQYFPIQIAGCTYMVCDPVIAIAEAKEQGNPKLAGALWAGIKAGFMREKSD